MPLVAAETFSDLLRDFAGEADLETVASASGVSVHTLIRLRTGTARTVQLATLEQLAACFELPVDRILAAIRATRVQAGL